MDHRGPAAPSNPAATGASLGVTLLGRFAVAVGGCELPPEHWTHLRAAQLVQLLALQPAHRLPREQAIDALWPRLDPDAGAANLRKAAHHARRALGAPDAVVLQGGEVALWPGRTVQVDAQDFERRAQAALAGGEAGACDAAAAAYAGELLPGSPYESWTGPARERLRALHCSLLRTARRWDRLAEADPTDEPAHRALMAREVEAGNRAAAIRWYARLRTALQQALGAGPDPETEALYRRCIADLQPAAGPPLLGRELQQAQVAAWLELAPRERPLGAALVGPAGIGKSALGRELMALARQRGWAALAVDAVQPGRPYAVIAAAADRVILQDRGALERVGASARSVLALLTPLAGPPDALPPGPLGRHQVIGAFRRLLLAHSDGGPLMLRVDDAHLADDADIDVLLHLAASGPPVFVLLAMREPAAGSPLARGIGRLSGSGRLPRVELGPLHGDDLHALVAQSAPQALTGEAVAELARLSGGNPFAAIELARVAGPGGARGPASAAEAITRRLCDVPAAALDLLRWLALVGDDFDAKAVVALAPDTEAHAYEALDAALALGVLVVTDAHYRFRHELVRQALIEQIAPHHRLRMHREAAARLAALDAAPAVVARHWLAGGSRREARAWSLAAARDALRLAAFSDALRLLTPVLEFEPAQPQALKLRAEALDAIGDAGAVAAYRAAAEVAAAEDADDLRAKGALAQIKQGDPQGALEAMKGLRPRSVEGRLCEALAYCGAAALGATDAALGSRKAAEARRLALQTGDQATIVIASWAQAAAAHARGELHRSVLADLRETQDLPHLATRVFDGQLCILQRFLYGARPYAEVIAFAESLTAEARRLGAARGEAFGVTIRGEAELLSGDLDAAEAHLLEGARLHRAIGAMTGEAFSLQRLAEVALLRGRRDEARTLLDEALDLARQTDIGFHLLDRIYGTRIALAADADEGLHALQDAREAVRGPLETCPGCRITFAVPAAIAAARAGRLDLAAEYEGQSAYLADVVMRLPAWHAAHDEVRAHLAVARGESPGVVAAHFAAAAARFRQAGHPLDAARCEHGAPSPH